MFITITDKQSLDNINSFLMQKRIRLAEFIHHVRRECITPDGKWINVSPKTGNNLSVKTEFYGKVMSVKANVENDQKCEITSIKIKE